MAEGIAKFGDEPVNLKLDEMERIMECDHAVFYGFVHPLPQIMQAFKDSGRSAVHIDLGYWGRIEGGRLTGYHKVAVNARHPDAYFQNRQHCHDRLNHFGFRVRAWKRSGRNIIVAGMSAKHAASEGMSPQEWEIQTIKRLREITDRPIMYRPKPGDRYAKPIPGTEYIQANQIEYYFPDCWAVVTHHSNAAIDAAIAGIPSFSSIGVGKTISGDLEKIETPNYPSRFRWLTDIAYCQFNVSEMRSGLCWSHLNDEGLIK